MTRFLLAVLAMTLPAGCASGQAEADKSPSLQYTVRTEQGERSGKDREAVLKTIKMTVDQVREWAEDLSRAKESRSATLYQNGYVEVVGRDAAGQLQYAVRDGSGVRSSHNRKSVLTTRKMTADQLKTWTEAPEAKAEGRILEPNPKGVAQETISSARGRVFSQGSKSASGVLKLTDEKIREWAADPKGEKEGRGAILFQAGHVEIIWRGPTGKVLYSVRNEHGSRTSQDRDSVVKTLKMTDEQVRTWVEDKTGEKEGRAATFSRAGYAEVISWGSALEPPGAR